jgi:trans-aconitate methyltransferase
VLLKDFDKSDIEKAKTLDWKDLAFNRHSHDVEEEEKQEFLDNYINLLKKTFKNTTN